MREFGFIGMRFVILHLDASRTGLDGMGLIAFSHLKAQILLDLDCLLTVYREGIIICYGRGAVVQDLQRQVFLCLDRDFLRIRLALLAQP